MSRTLIGLVAFVAVSAAIIIGAYMKGGSDTRDRTDLENATDYIEGTQDAQDARTDLPDTDTGIVEWLLRPWD